MKRHLTAGQIVALRDGEELRQAFVVHLNSCERCGRRLDIARGLAALVKLQASRDWNNSFSVRPRHDLGILSIELTQGQPQLHLARFSSRAVDAGEPRVQIAVTASRSGPILHIRAWVGLELTLIALTKPPITLHTHHNGYARIALPAGRSLLRIYGDRIWQLGIEVIERKKVPRRNLWVESTGDTASFRKTANDLAPLREGPSETSWFLYGSEGFKQLTPRKAYGFQTFKAAEVVLYQDLGA